MANESVRTSPVGVAIILLTAGAGMTLEGAMLPPSTSWLRWLGVAVLGAGVVVMIAATVRPR
jgi:hypothetical protein